MTDKERIAKAKAQIKVVEREIRKMKRLLKPFRPMRIRRDDADYPRMK